MGKQSITCPYCFTEVSINRSNCHNCGARKYFGSTTFEKAAYAALGAAFGIIIAVTFGLQEVQVLGTTILGMLLFTGLAMYTKKKVIRFAPSSP